MLWVSSKSFENKNFIVVAGNISMWPSNWFFSKEFSALHLFGVYILSIKTDYILLEYAKLWNS